MAHASTRMHAPTRTHSRTPQYTYKCIHPSCPVEIGRQSKSIDTARKVCGRCGSRLELVGGKKADGTPRKLRKPTAFSKFVGERYGAAKEAAGKGAGHAEAMKVLSGWWKEEKRKRV